VFYEVRMGSVLCLLSVSLHTLLALSCEQLASATHEDMGGGTEDVEVGDTRLLICLSIDGELTSHTLPQRRGWLLRASATLPGRRVLQKAYRGFSCLVFDHPPALASTVAPLE
jgi:hypothetical protein